MSLASKRMGAARAEIDIRGDGSVMPQCARPWSGVLTRGWPS
jgi:hypothetical protein